MLTTGNQLRAARALVDMGQGALAEAAGVNVNTISSMEKRGSSTLSSGLDVIRRVQAALEAIGVEFLNHGRPGVRLGQPVIAIDSAADLERVPREIGALVRIPTSAVDLWEVLSGRGFHGIRSDGQHHVMRRDFHDGAIALNRQPGA